MHLVAVDITPASAAASPTLPAGPYLRVTIRNTGMGMTSEVMVWLFEPFFTTEGASEGTGLGLAVVYSMIMGRPSQWPVLLGRGRHLLSICPDRRGAPGRRPYGEAVLRGEKI